MTNTGVPFGLERTVLTAPLQSILPNPQVLPADDLSALSPTLVTSPSQVQQNPLFADLPQARPFQPAARSFLARNTATPVDPNYQRNLTTLENKYTDLAPFMDTLPPAVRNALVTLDTRRVSQGSSPLTREQTIKAAATAVSNKPATPTPERAGGLFGVFSNARSDLSDILKSIPRVPAALAHELADMPNISRRIQEAQDAGMNPISAALSAPGLRMIPGAYAASNLLEGNISELTSHPLFTALDVLPGLNKLAAGTPLARGVRAAHEAQTVALGQRLNRTLPMPSPRPISAVLTNRLNPAAAGGIERNIIGRGFDRFRETTPIGQRLESGFGRRARMVAKEQGRLEQRLKMFMMGAGDPKTPLESLVRDVAPMFKKWEKDYPFLSTSPNTPPKLAAQYRTQRAQFYETLTGPDPTSTINPAFVSDIRDLLYRDQAYHHSIDRIGMFDNEAYPTAIADRLIKADQRAQSSTRMAEMRNEYLAPSGSLTTAQFRAYADDIRQLPKRHQMDAARALEATLDAYGLEIKPLRSARAGIALKKGDWDAWYQSVDDALSTPGLVLKPRASMSDIIDRLRTQRADAQAKALETALLNNNVGQVTQFLDNLYSRKPPTFDPALYPDFRADVRSMSRRRKFDATVGIKRARLMERHAKAVKALRDQNAPARFGPELSRRIYGEVDPTSGKVLSGAVSRGLRQEAEVKLWRTLSPEEAGRFARDVYDKQWANLPGVDPQFASDYAATVAREVTATWRQLRADGADPVFVHKVTPQRVQQQDRVGPTPTTETHLAERAVDLTPDAMRDVQVSLTHQAAESLGRAYSEQYIDNIIKIVGKSETELQQHFLAEARATASIDPTMTSRGWLQKLTKDSYKPFNPVADGFSWGGERFTNFYTENKFYIPTSIHNNLKQYAKQPNLFTSTIDPLTKAFRYNVIGLSPSIIINNFFSNAVAMTAERGIRPWLHFQKAWDWAKNPMSAKMPDELRAVFLAEQRHMDHLGMDAYLTTRNGQKFMAGTNAATAWRESAVREGLARGKSALDSIVEKSLHLQRLGDNVYRGMIYMDAIENGKKLTNGGSRALQEATALDLVNRTLIDYASQTPIERTAIRTIIPFYSYMGHAARFIARYPLNHPMRASIVSKIADSERERLGSLPGSFLSFFPIGSIDSMGKMIMLNLRPFDPFGDQADMLTISGWVAAMNPAIQIGLRQVGVSRGEAEIYPTLRYDPETGRMRAVRPNPLTDLLMTAIPRAGVLASLTGLNPDYNELRARDQAAADRSLAAQLGLPRLWREFNVPQEQIKSELSRQQVESDVLNEAMRSGDWDEALRYPNLRSYYQQIGTLSPDEIAAMTPAAPDALAGVVQQDILGG